MKKLNRILSFILAVAMLITCVTVPVVSSANYDIVHTTTDATGAPGEQIDVEVKVSGFDIEAAGYSVRVYFDTDIVTLDSYTYNSTMDGSTPYNGTTYFSCADDDSQGIMIEGTMYTLHFTISDTAEPGTYTDFFRLERTNLCDNDFNEWNDEDVTLVHGDLTVTGGTTSEPEGIVHTTTDATGAPGEQIDVEVKVSGFEVEAAGYSVRVYFDTDIVTLDSYTYNSTMDGSTPYNGTTYFSCADDDSQGIMIEGTMYTLHFTISDTATPGTYTDFFRLERTNLCDNDFNEWNDEEQLLTAVRLTLLMLLKKVQL